MSNEIDIEASLAAHQQVKQAIEGLRGQLRQNAKDVEKTESAIHRLENGYPPFELLKSAIVEHALAWSEDQARNEVINGLRDLCRDKNRGSMHGKPLSYKEVRANFPTSGAFLTGRGGALRSVLFSEYALHFFCRDVVRAKLTELLDTMVPSDFGYGSPENDKVGPGWSERDAQLTELGKQLESLDGQRKQIVERLVQFGVPQNNIWGN